VRSTVFFGLYGVEISVYGTKDRFDIKQKRLPYFTNESEEFAGNSHTIGVSSARGRVASKKQHKKTKDAPLSSMSHPSDNRKILNFIRLIRNVCKLIVPESG
jgi:hypothetical protein